MRCARRAETILEPHGATIQSISDREFALFQALVRAETGIALSSAKKSLVVGRLSGRLRELGLRSFGEYFQHVNSGDGAERRRMVDSICTNETQFFREPRQFEYLEKQVIPAWVARAAAGQAPRRVRIWSAACSTGEEPYSLAMSLLTFLTVWSGWEIEILASDLSTRALARAREAVWPLEKSAHIPQKYLKAFMLKGTGPQQGKMIAGPEIRSVVRFEHINLCSERYPVEGLFDLILCRNVLIYFDTESKTRVVHQLLRHLAPPGYLFVGHAESMAGLTDRLRSVMPTVYAHA